MSPRVRAYFELVRVPNVFTAIADPLAGFLFAGGSLMNWPTLAALCLASACLYSAGMVLNDIADAPRDAQSRPTRPIPSGRVSLRVVQLLCGALFLAGFLFAAATGARTALLAGALITAIVLYDVFLKPTPFAAPTMGLCRALNLALGMSAALTPSSIPPYQGGTEGGLPFTAEMIADAALFDPTTDSLLRIEYLLPLALMWLYITSVTLFARREAAGDTRTRLTLATLSLTAAILGLSTLPFILPRAGATDKLSLSVPFSPGAMPTPPQTHESRSAIRVGMPLSSPLTKGGPRGVDDHQSSNHFVAGVTDKRRLSVPFSADAMSLVTPPRTPALAPVLLLATFLAATGLRAAHNPSPASIQRAVKTFILCIILFDACLTWTAAGPAPATAVAALVIPSLLLSRAFRMT